MSIDQQILESDLVDRLVSAARQVHDKCPGDARTGDKWPLASLAMQYFFIEDERTFQREMLRQQGELVRGTWWMVRVALIAAVISILAIALTLMRGTS